MDSIRTLFNFLFLLPQILVLAATIILMMRKKGPIPLLMLIGAISSLFVNIFYTLLMPLWFKMDLTNGLNNYAAITTFFSLLSIGGWICFGIGLLMLVLEITAPKHPTL